MKFRFLAAVFDRALRAELGRRACALALLAHRRLEPREVDRDIALARNVGGEIERKTERVVEPEDRIAVEHLVFRLQCAFEHRHAVFQRFREPLLFLLEYLRDALARGREFGITLRPSP